ncbi:MAG TPA: tripartite tricarboxylate transporter substrate-binding protein [Burkholderiales bacterium]|nr:tripartite tricarboxylate transporter substrate-binding protein [Burkholderiales bacterium]
MSRRLRTLALALAAAAPLCALAQSYPTKPVRFVLTNPPGGTVDLLARTLSDELAKRFQQPFVIENRPGANGTIGGQVVVAGEPDAHTLLLGPPGPIAINKLMYRMPFDPQEAFAPVSLVAIAPLVLVVNPALPVKTFQEFLAYAKSHPGRISYASQGNGSSGHLAMELLKSQAGIFAPGRLRALAVAEPQRLKAEPGIPTIAESGLPGFQATPWFGVVAKAGSPKPAIDALAGAIAQIVKLPHVEGRFSALGVQLVGSTPEEFRAHIASELLKWEAVVARSGAKLD